MVKIVEDDQVLTDQNFIMEASVPAPLVFGIVDNEGKHALEPTLIQLRVDTRHALPPHSQIEIGVPKQLGLPETDDELSCWVDSSPFTGDVECKFDRAAYTFLLKDVILAAKHRS